MSCHFHSPACHSERGEESVFLRRRGKKGKLLLRFARRCSCRGTRLRRRPRGFRARALPDRQVFAHFFEPFGPQAADRQQVVHALERSIRLAHLQDFLRRRRPNPRHLLQFRRTRRIEIDRSCRRLLLRKCGKCGKETQENGGSNAKRNGSPTHGATILHA